MTLQGNELKWRCAGIRPLVGASSRDIRQTGRFLVHGGPLAGTVYQAEAAALSGGAAAEKTQTDYTGAGFVSGYDQAGAATTFTVPAREAGQYQVTLRYASAMPTQGAEVTRTLSVYVNGAKAGQTGLPSLANWDTWDFKMETLTLQAGDNTITYQYDPGDSGGAHLDALNVAKVVEAGPTPTAVPTASPTVAIATAPPHDDRGKTGGSMDRRRIGGLGGVGGGRGGALAPTLQRGVDWQLFAGTWAAPSPVWQGDRPTGPTENVYKKGGYMAINRVATVCIFVTDQDRAKAFYTQALGFEVRSDEVLYPGGAARWLAVAPRGAETEIILYRMDQNWEHYRGIMGKSQALTIDVTDMSAVQAELKARGVTFMQAPEKQPWGTFATIEDPDGNQLLLVERPAAP